jgi:hypothetical protein
VICWQRGSFLILHHKRLTKGLKQTHVGVIGVVAPSRHDNKAVADHIFHDHNVLSFHDHRHHQIHHSNNLQQPLCLHFPPSALFPHTLFPHSLAFKWPHVHIQSKANVNASVATSVVFLFGCQDSIGKLERQVVNNFPHLPFHVVENIKMWPLKIRVALDMQHFKIRLIQSLDCCKMQGQLFGVCMMVWNV